MKLGDVLSMIADEAECQVLDLPDDSDEMGLVLFDDGVNYLPVGYKGDLIWWSRLDPREETVIDIYHNDGLDILINDMRDHNIYCDHSDEEWRNFREWRRKEVNLPSGS